MSKFSKRHYLALAEVLIDADNARLADELGADARTAILRDINDAREMAHNGESRARVKARLLGPSRKAIAQSKSHTVSSVIRGASCST